MKITMSLVLSIALVAVAGLFSSAIFGLIDVKPDAQTSATVSGLITGHVITTHSDAAGNILSYRQSDNLIVNQGENCVSKRMFSNSTTGTTVCTGLNNDGFRYISIGNGTATVASDNVRLDSEHNATSYGQETAIVSSGNVLLRQPATMNWASSNSTGSGSGTVADVIMTAIFKNVNGGAGTTVGTGAVMVTESGLFNVTSKTIGTDGVAFSSIVNQDGMFARQTFSQIQMNPSDTLTVQWTMSVGGSTLANLTP